MNQPTSRVIDYHLNLPYAILLIPGDKDDGGWLAKIPDLPGCITFGDTKEEGYPIPEPQRVTWPADSHGG